ncbi:hypothetical protein I79_008755 [Cricetulus griseus]|uniref:Uncharacterized protein n=1 Tax=Cricetulus griseus TaxID=10029 RepID=G3HDY6_CRIGR|nr:hypothetical protein I79_008755 [Cricetulus griseus]
MEECCLLTCSACVLTALRATTPVVAPPRELNCSTSSIKKVHHRLTHRQTW